MARISRAAVLAVAIFGLIAAASAAGEKAAQRAEFATDRAASTDLVLDLD